MLALLENHRLAKQEIFANETFQALQCLDNIALQMVTALANRTWLENLAVRPNGQILATRLDVPELYQITPDPHNPKPTLIYAFPSALGTLGIAELPATPMSMLSSSVTFLSRPSPLSPEATPSGD
ncbi:hypothetical protein C8R44DRAFT_881260 [Mycena epipterygia]|nr:hypothetical protein C8R44DRAFT_881260 [Mycena epipterygia]